MERTDSRTCIRTYVFGGGFTGLDVDRTGLYSGLLVLKAASWSFTYEVQMFGGGRLETPWQHCPNAPGLALEFEYAFDMAGRLELYPSMMAQVSTIGVEAGWAQGDDGTYYRIRLKVTPFRSARPIT